MGHRSDFISIMITRDLLTGILQDTISTQTVPAFLGHQITKQSGLLTKMVTSSRPAAITSILIMVMLPCKGINLPKASVLL